MKEIFGFIGWQWRKWELWQKIFIVSMTVFVGAVLLPNPYDVYVVGTLMFVMLGWTFKWAVWDNVQANWQKYKQERNQLLQIIKDSDR
jgi:protein-S-isoprenylcysteine O-methyltransferase Ste14